MLYLPVPSKVFGLTNLTDVLKDSVKAFIAPPVLMPKNPLYNNPQVYFMMQPWHAMENIFLNLLSLCISLFRMQAKECVDSFFFYNEHTFVMFLEICGFNRARQRDKIARLLDNFASLQDEVNIFLMASHISSCNMAIVLRLSESILFCISN